MRKTPPMPTHSQSRRILSSRTASVTGLLLFATLFRPPAKATEVYAYQGQDYTFATGGYTTADYISGDFTTPTPLAANLTGHGIVPQTYSFADGYFDWTNTDSTIQTFTVTTDAYGTLASADIQLSQLHGSDASYLYITPGGDSVATGLDLHPAGDATNSTAGIWGPDFDPLPPAVPEPASVFLASTALVAFALRAGKRIGRGVGRG